MKDLETPSGKGAGDENFPVGSWLLSAALRPHVLAFYHFVRAADDVADDPKLTADEKLHRLGLFEQALLGDQRTLRKIPKAAALRHSLAETGVTERHAFDLLKAFKQDAIRNRYADWTDLLNYCACSASPVGRYLLDLHGEDKALYQLSDPLCDALQVLNHLQDCTEDFKQLDRVYLPEDRFALAGIQSSALAARHSSQGFRVVLDGILDDTDALLQKAAGLPAALHSRRLGAEAAVVLEMAKALSAKLHREDPIASRVQLGKSAFGYAAVRGLLRLQWARRGGRHHLSTSTEAFR
jgi:squalene synthase HpnC